MIDYKFNEDEKIELSSMTENITKSLPNILICFGFVNSVLEIVTIGNQLLILNEFTADKKDNNIIGIIPNSFKSPDFDFSLPLFSLFFLLLLL